MQELIDFANQLADEAGAIVRQYFRQDLNVSHKSKEQPVTIADREVEIRLREMIEKRFPSDGIFGEEYGVKVGASGRDWVLDPIDGTKPFIIGRPTFGTLISLCEEMRPILGIIDQPVLRERWVGAKNFLTTFNGAPVHVRACNKLAMARVASTSPSQLTPGIIERLYAAAHLVVWGGDCYSYGLLSNGWLDAVVESGLQPYDFCALVPVVEGAGGKMCDWEGEPLTMESAGQTVAVGDAQLTKEILELLERSD